MGWENREGRPLVTKNPRGHSLTFALTVRPHWPYASSVVEERIPPADHRLPWRRLKVHGAGDTLIEEINVGADPLLNDAIRRLQYELEITRIVQAAASALAALQAERELKVHLGCGPDIRSGWLNIDLIVGREARQRAENNAAGRFLNFDLRRGLPLADGSCEIIYSSHFFEHLEYRHGVALMRDCHRCLKPGATFRLALPDFRKVFASYVAGDNRENEAFDRLVGPEFGSNFELIRGLEPEIRGRAMVDYLNYAVYQYGEHKTIYDEQKLIILLERIGFRSVAATDFREDLDPSSELRRNSSFYVEATK